MNNGSKTTNYICKWKLLSLAFLNGFIKHGLVNINTLHLKIYKNLQREKTQILNHCSKMCHGGEVILILFSRAVVNSIAL